MCIAYFCHWCLHSILYVMFCNSLGTKASAKYLRYDLIKQYFPLDATETDCPMEVGYLGWCWGSVLSPHQQGKDISNVWVYVCVFMCVSGVWVSWWHKVLEIRRLRIGYCGGGTSTYCVWDPHICGPRDHRWGRVSISEGAFEKGHVSQEQGLNRVTHELRWIHLFCNNFILYCWCCFCASNRHGYLLWCNIGNVYKRL